MTKEEYIEVELIKLRALHKWSLNGNSLSEANKYRYQIMFLENELKRGTKNGQASSRNFKEITL